jgi:hypothetical protein
LLYYVPVCLVSMSVAVLVYRHLQDQIADEARPDTEKWLALGVLSLLHFGPVFLQQGLSSFTLQYRAEHPEGTLLATILVRLALDVSAACSARRPFRYTLFGS